MTCCLSSCRAPKDLRLTEHIFCRPGFVDILIKRWQEDLKPFQHVLVCLGLLDVELCQACRYQDFCQSLGGCAASLFVMRLSSIWAFWDHCAGNSQEAFERTLPWDYHQNYLGAAAATGSLLPSFERIAKHDLSGARTEIAAEGLLQVLRAHAAEDLAALVEPDGSEWPHWNLRRRAYGT